jgi:hypothetical protein
MAATVDILRWTGTTGSPVKTIITGINTRANAMDAHSLADTSSPVQIPPSGSNYSFWVCTRLAVGSTGPAGTINNLRWYSDGANNFGTGITAQGNEATAYTQAVGTVGQTGTQLTTGVYPSVTTPVDCFTLTAAAPKALAGTISNPSTNVDIGSFFVYQITVASTAGPGATSQETWTWKYDET